MNVKEHTDSMRRMAWQAKVDAMRDGRVQRAANFGDKRKEAARKACRGRVR